MATSYPSSLDTFTNPQSTDLLSASGVSHADQHADVNDAVEALQAKVGVDGSAVTSSHDYKIRVQSVVPYADSAARATAVPSPVEGQMSYLEDTDAVEVYDGTEWTTISGGQDPISLNENTVTEDFTIPSGFNGLSAGPITIADGITVTVADGSAWAVV